MTARPAPDVVPPRRLSWLGLCALLVALPALAQTADPSSLRKAIDLRYPGVPWVSTTQLADWLKGPSPRRPRLLDARTAAEFAVSHLRGARRIDPDHPDVQRLKWPHGARVVVYCSVGYRSAAVARALRQAGYEHVYNLQGGLFAWANQGRPLYRGEQRVSKVHPYDATWGQFLAPQYRAKP